MRHVAAVLLGLSLALGGACAWAQAGGRAYVFAAASLKNALDDALRAYPGARPALVYGASSRLARQIEGGAPASLFISADRQWMDYLAARGAIVAQSRQDLLGNRLVLIAPRASRVQLGIAPGMRLVEALGGGRLALGDPAHVPAGLYARAALEKLGIWDAVKTRLAPAGDVRAALALVARGETPLGIVYATDAAAEPSVRVVGEFDASLHPPIVYPLALVQGTSRTAGTPSEAARDFAAYLRTEAAAGIFARHGFIPLNRR